MTSPVQILRPRAEDVPDSPAAFLEWLGRASILIVEGRDASRTRVVSGLMHGNEPSGLHGIHAWIGSGEVPAVRTAFFIGGVDAARTSPELTHRFVPGRRDLNRCFRAPFEGVDGAIAEAALDCLFDLEPEAVLDVHNNTGRNPAYGIVHQLDDMHLGLVAHFSHTAVLSDLFMGTFVEPFLGRAPAAIIECGKAHTAEADAIAEAGIRRFLRADHIEPVLVMDPPMRVLANAMRVELAEGKTLAFGAGPTDASLTLDAELDQLNFQLVRAGTRIGWTRCETLPFRVVGPDGTNRAQSYFERVGDEVRTVRTFVPTMITLSVAAALSDCLFYAADQR